MEWYSITVFISISLMANDGEQVLMYLLGIFISSLEENLLKFFAKFKIGLFVFLRDEARVL